MAHGRDRSRNAGFLPHVQHRMRDAVARAAASSGRVWYSDLHWPLSFERIRWSPPAHGLVRQGRPCGGRQREEACRLSANLRTSRCQPDWRRRPRDHIHERDAKDGVRSLPARRPRSPAVFGSTRRGISVAHQRLGLRQIARFSDCATYSVVNGGLVGCQADSANKPGPTGRLREDEAGESGRNQHWCQ